MSCSFKKFGFNLWIVNWISKLLYEKKPILSDLVWPK